MIPLSCSDIFLQLVMAAHSSHLLIARYFNQGDIDWQNDLSMATPSHCSHNFLRWSMIISSTSMPASLPDSAKGTFFECWPFFHKWGKYSPKPKCFTRIGQKCSHYPKACFDWLHSTCTKYHPQIVSKPWWLPLIGRLGPGNFIECPIDTSIDTQYQSLQSKLENLCLQCRFFYAFLGLEDELS